MLSGTCPECGNELKPADEASGHPLVCPLCRREIATPDVPAVAAPDESATPSDLEARVVRPKRRLPEEGDYGPRRRRKRHKKRSFWLGVGLAIFGTILACGGLGVGAYFLFIHEIDIPVAATDRSMLVTAKRITEFVPTLRIDPARETFQKVRMLDGSRDLRYEYESIEDADNILYVSHQVCVDQTIDGAQGGYIGLRIGTKFFAFHEMQEIERNDLWKWGDKSKCTILMKGDKHVGNLFMARKGRRYFYLIIVGVYFEKPGAIHELLDPFLQRFDTYEG